MVFIDKQSKDKMFHISMSPKRSNLKAVLYRAPADIDMHFIFYVMHYQSDIAGAAGDAVIVIVTKMTRSVRRRSFTKKKLPSE